MLELYARMEEYAAGNKIPIMGKEAVDFLFETVKNMQPASILEIGTAVGYSGLKMLEAAPRALLKTVEIDEARYLMAAENFAAAGVKDRVEQWLGDAEEIVRYATGSYGFILLDGSKGTYARLLPYLTGLLEKGGALFADNVLFKGKTEAEGAVAHKNRTIVASLREYLDKVKKDSRLTSTLYNIGDGVCLSVKI